MNSSKFQVFKNAINNQYYYHLKAANGEKILSGEGYTTKQSCFNGVASVKVNGRDDSRYERKNSDLNYAFNLKSPNGEIVGRSENYTSLSGREKGITAVMEDAATAHVEDLS